MAGCDGVHRIGLCSGEEGVSLHEGVANPKHIVGMNLGTCEPTEGRGEWQEEPPHPPWTVCPAAVTPH